MNEEEPNKHSLLKWPLMSECVGRKKMNEKSPNKRDMETLIVEALDKITKKRSQINLDSLEARRQIAKEIASEIANDRTPNKRDKCVSCHAETEYDEFDHIDLRYFYVEGAGQLCAECWKEIYEQKNPK